MTISALLTAELLINQCGNTGKMRNVGLMELYASYLGGFGGRVAGVAFLVVSYLVMGVYLSEGGDCFKGLLMMSAGGDGAVGETLSSLSTSTTTTRAIYATLTAAFLSTASKYGAVQRAMTNYFVPTTLAACAFTIAMALPTADLNALTSLNNQHPEFVLNAFPLLFMSWTYHGVVPRVVYDLEGDKDNITKAIVGGSTAALLIYLTWNAVILGNVLSDSSGEAIALALSTTATNPIHLIRNTQLQSAITVVSELAITTSLIGVVLGFVNEFYDAIGAVPSQTYGPKEDNKYRVALLTLIPPAIVSVALGYFTTQQPPLLAVDNYQIIDYAGAFGASTLFLILPALMTWQNRYGDEARPLSVKPMVPLGKITLSSLYKAAGTLIVEQGLDKLGVFEFVQRSWEGIGGSQ